MKYLCEMVQRLWKMPGRSPLVRHKVPIGPAIPCPGMFPGGMNHMFTQKPLHIVFEQHLFIPAKKCESTQKSIS